MKILKQFLFISLLSIVISSCSKEPLNAECDIVTAVLPGDIQNRDAIIENNKVTFIVKNGANISALAPEFTLTPGATIDPPSGTTRNFDTPQTYVTTSEDGNWHKTYTVEVAYADMINLEYNFENVRTETINNSTFDVFFEIDAQGREALTWASGNGGFALTGIAYGKDDPSLFPTYQINEGKSGKAAAMTTRRTGVFGAMANKPIASGSLFTGQFVLSDAMAHPLEATQFGTPFVNIPRTLKGYFKYTPGETYYEFDKTASGKLRPIEGKVDKFNIYAVFFETTDDMQHLDGNDTMSPDNPNIVATAEIPDAERVASSEWKRFEIPFDYRTDNIDLNKLKEGRYSITIVFASSIDGDFFSGAPGSTLIVDEVELSCLEE